MRDDPPMRDSSTAGPRDGQPAISCVAVDELRPGFEAAADAQGDAEDRRILRAVEQGLFGSARIDSRRGRYEIVRELGAGAFGVVYEGVDPVLNRRVAIKVFKTGVEGTAGVASMIRREAQAIARVQHPNVVAVLDVGLDRDELFIAMELVEGINLRDWLARRTRPTREVMDVLRAAGMGLAAVHAEGLVHRDFKPANVLLDGLGRARLADFGLATVAEALQRSAVTGGGIESESGEGGLRTTLSSADAIVGTPGYMAPEQHAGGTVEAAADQYAFCVTVYEALVGQRPFRADSLVDLARLKAGGDLEWPADASVPSHVRAALSRGLQPDPLDRFGSMSELLQGLRPRRRSVAWTWAAAAGLAVTLTGVALSPSAEQSPCERFLDDVTQTWNTEHREAIAQALAATEAPHAAWTTRRVLAGLDDRVDGLRSSYRRVCEAEHSGAETSRDEATQASAMDCLAAQHRDLRSVVDLLEQADAHVTREARLLVAELPEADRCTQPNRDTEFAPPEREEVDAVATLSAELSVIRVLTHAGRYDEARTRLAAASDQLDALRYVPVKLQAQAAAGQLEWETKAQGKALSLFDDLAVKAAAHGLDAMALNAMLRSAQGRTLPDGNFDLDEARWWIRHAESLAESVDDPALRAKFALTSGTIDLEAGQLQAAEKRFRSGVRTLQMHQPESHVLANAHQLLGATLAYQQRHREAAEHFETSVITLERIFGPDHPRLGDGLLNLANHLAVNGETERGLEAAQRALSIAEANDMDDALELRLYLEAVAVNLMYAERMGEAEEFFERALTLAKQTMDEQHPVVLGLVANLGIIKNLTGDPLGAIPLLERAVEGLDQASPSDQNRARVAMVNLGRAYRDAGRYDDAEATFRRVLALDEDAAAADIWSALGLLETTRGRADKAVEYYARAVEVSDEFDTDTLRAAARWRLAGALIETGELQRARELGCWAVAHLQDQSEGLYARSRVEAEGWLREVGADCEALR